MKSKSIIIWIFFFFIKNFILRLINLITSGNRNHIFMDKQIANIRDEFNLNKILIVVTSVGKVIIVYLELKNKEE